MLGSMISDLNDREYQFTVYRSSDENEIEAWLRERGISVESHLLPPGGPAPFIELQTDGEVVGVISIKAIEGLLDPPIRRPGERDEISEAYRVLFDALDKTVMSGMNRRELLAVSREIEDRAYRVGSGTLRVCFQHLSIFKSQMDVYRTLAAETDLDIHIHGLADWNPPPIDGLTYHSDGAEQVEPYWVIGYDGGPTESQACGLVAQEYSHGYTGFWTNDPVLVEEITAALAEI